MQNACFFYFKLINTVFVVFDNSHNRFVQFINRERTLKHSIYLYLGMQFGGVLFSTSHAANSFIGTGLFMLDTRSRVIFSVIFDSLINLHHPKCGAHKQNKKLFWSYKNTFSLHNIIRPTLVTQLFTYTWWQSIVAVIIIILCTQFNTFSSLILVFLPFSLDE